MSSSSSDSCYGTRNSCPSTSITSCNHYEDITVACSKYLLIHINLLNDLITKLLSIPLWHSLVYNNSYPKTFNSKATCSGLICK